MRKVAGDCRSLGAAVSGLGLLLSVSVLLLSFDFGTHVLASNDEARFPMLARDMLAHGRWLLPRLNGAPHLYKPPLYPWLIALMSWPTGEVTQSTAALPNLLAALGVVVLTYWIARRLFNDTGTALAAGLIVVTTVGMFEFARVVKTDMTLCLGLTAAMAAFVAAKFGGDSRAYIAAFALLGVASLTKGPVALLGVVVMIAYTLMVDGRSGLRRMGLSIGLVLVGAPRCALVGRRRGL